MFNRPNVEVSQGTGLCYSLVITFRNKSQNMFSLNTGVTITFNGEVYYLAFGNLRIRWDTKDYWELTIVDHGSNPPATKGLCGNNNNNPSGE